MRSYSLNFFILAVFSIVGCGGETHPSPEQTPGWDPVEAYAKAIKGEVTNLLAVAAANPQEVALQADATLESFDDGANAGQYADTIAQIKEKVSALAAGRGNVAELKELVAKLPGETPEVVDEYE
jgi:hypothetical protein